ncbi:MAG: ATP-binding protein [Planctomycetota bacterium]|nr:MAG: ATP-binding protein [Planctomycetota bacterium]
MPDRQEPIPDIRLELVSQPRYLCCVRELMLAVAERYGFGEPDRSKVALAVDEALANIICHGYRRRPDGRIWLSVWPLDPPAAGSADPRGIRVVLEDHADQVEPEQIRGRDLDEIRPGGLGVHIIREIMDRVEYSRRPGAGMRLVMEKQAPPTPRRAAADRGLSP